MIDKSNIQIINTRAPIGDSTKYTINFTLQSDTFSISSARIMIDKEELEELREGDKPQKVIDLVKAELFSTEKEESIGSTSKESLE